MPSLNPSPRPNSVMAAPAPAAPAPAPAAVDDPAAKRQRLATTEVAAWTPPQVTHAWTIPDLTVASFTGAANTDLWNGPEFNAVGLRWRLSMRPKIEHPTKKVPGLGFFLRLLDRTSAPVELAEVTLQVRGMAEFKVTNRFYVGDAQHFPEGPPCFSSWGCVRTQEDLTRKAASILAGGQMVYSATLRSRSFADLAVPMPLAPALPALIAAALPASGSELADGVDVVFKAAGERIGAHSLILALRSSTLRASLWGPLAAKGAALRRELDIPEGIDTATFKRVLAFMYTDAVPEFETPDPEESDPKVSDSEESGLSASEVHALLHAADYLNVQRLREICVAELHKRLVPDTAVSTLRLAHALSCTPLLDATLRYIAGNAQAVMRAPSWAELMLEPGLLQAAMSTMATGEPPSVIAEPPAALQASAPPPPPADTGKAAPKRKRK